jgi:hypothetical protein
VHFRDPAQSSALVRVQVEADYVGGIDRLPDPLTVRIAVDGAGLEISELMPGTRIVRLDANSLLEARVVDASTWTETASHRSWADRLLSMLFGRRRDSLAAKIKNHEYVLTIRYRGADGNGSAVFKRSDRSGYSDLQSAAQASAALIESDVPIKKP